MINTVQVRRATLEVGVPRFVPPNIRDPRLHVAAVIISIHLIGIFALGFQVSVPQVLSAILAGAIVEVLLTYRRSSQFVWPASAMLTGSGVALILRMVGMPAENYWSWRDWYWYAIIACLGVLSKYALRTKTIHLFNPSNLALVAAFLVLGEERVEPLDFWWGPLHPWLGLAYAIILVGGIVIASRLRLLDMSVAFWIVLATALAILASFGHCITTSWSLTPVCGSHFWTTVLTSPEVLIFLFFMITDPKTVPTTPAGRRAFAITTALLGALLLAPQTTEFGAKVGLLAGLTVSTPIRMAFDRFTLTERRRDQRARQLAEIGLACAIAVAGIIVARGPARPGDLDQAPIAVPLVEIDPSTLPHVELGADVLALQGEIADDPVELAVALATDLEVENRAAMTGSVGLLGAADHGERLASMGQRIAEMESTGETKVTRHRFDSLTAFVVYVFGGQNGPSIGMHATGTAEQIVYNEMGVEIRRSSGPFEATYVMGRPHGDAWLIVGTIDG